MYQRCAMAKTIMPGVMTIIYMAASRGQAHCPIPPNNVAKTTGRVRTDDFVLEVSDEGMGMSSDDLLRIKEPYFSRRSGGTGLGVAIANGIIEQHGGTLSFESRVGAGTTARLVLPLTALLLPHGEP